MGITTSLPCCNTTNNNFVVVDNLTGKSATYVNARFFDNDNVVTWNHARGPLGAGDDDTHFVMSEFEDFTRRSHKSIHRCSKDLKSTKSERWSFRGKQPANDNDDDTDDEHFPIVDGITDTVQIYVPRVDKKIDDLLSDTSNWRDLNVRLSGAFVGGGSVSGPLSAWMSVFKRSKLNIENARDAILYDSISCRVDTDLLNDKATGRKRTDDDVRNMVRNRLSSILNGTMLTSNPDWFFVMNTVGGTPDFYHNSNLRLFEWIKDQTGEVTHARLRYNFFDIPIWGPPDEREMSKVRNYVSYRIRRSMDVNTLVATHSVTGTFILGRRMYNSKDSTELKNTRRARLVGTDGGIIEIDKDCHKSNDHKWYNFLFSNREAQSNCASIEGMTHSRHMIAPLPMAIALAVARTHSLEGTRWAASSRKFVRTGYEIAETSNCRVCHVRVSKEHINEGSNILTIVRLAYMRENGRNKKVEIWE